MAAWGSYSEYVHSLSQTRPPLQWLHDFLVTPEPQDCESCTFHLVHLDESRIYARPYRPRDYSLLEHLSDSPPKIRGRLIVIEYQNLEHVDKRMIDRICLKFDVDPFFLLNHFHPKAQNVPEPAPGSETKRMSFELGHLPDQHVSVQLLAPNEMSPIPTTLIFFRSKFAQAFMYESDRPSVRDASRPNQLRVTARHPVYQFLNNILLWKEQSLSLAIDQPSIFIFTLAELLAAEARARAQSEVERLAIYRAKAFDMNKDANRYFLDYEALEWDKPIDALRFAVRSTMENLEKLDLETFDASDNVQSSISKAALSASAKYAKVGALIESVHTEFLILEKRATNHRSLQASISAAEQTESLGFLTLLAYFYIPLTYISTIFGMNLKAFGNGTGTWRAWALSAVITLGWTILVMLFSYAYMMGKGILVKVLPVTPLGAFWLFVYGMTNYPPDFSSLITELGLVGHIGVDQTGRRTPIFLTAERKAKISPIWVTLLTPLAEVARDPGWESRRFWQRSKNQAKANTAAESRDAQVKA